MNLIEDFEEVSIPEDEIFIWTWDPTKDAPPESFFTDLEEEEISSSGIKFDDEETTSDERKSLTCLSLMTIVFVVGVIRRVILGVRCQVLGVRNKQQQAGARPPQLPINSEPATESQPIPITTL
nr:hypothetical protein [bacterium]